ncbi:MAG: hypothetical protein K9N55_11425 [Phycisphaerae bacterium]|nr:hypothetical protein [Phycisphaerae bacterium]
MKLMTHMMAFCLAVGLVVPCAGQPSSNSEKPVPGVGFVLKIDSTTIVNDPKELIELVQAYGSRADSLKYRIRVGNVTFRESPYSLTVFVHELASDVADASGFARSLVEYMDQTMQTYYSKMQGKLGERLSNLTDEKARLGHKMESLRGKMSEVSRVSPALQAQLDTMIDLSEFTPELPAAQAFETLRNAVSPPLNVTVLWKDLFDNAEIERTTPIDMDGIPAVSLGTALSVLLKALGGGFYELCYTVQDSVIVVGTRDGQQAYSSDPFLDLATVEHTSTSEINQQRRDLMDHIENLEMDIARQQSSNAAVELEISQIQGKINKALSSDPVLRDFESLVSVMQTNLEAVKDKNPSEYVAAMERMVSLRMKVAEHKARLVNQTGGDELARISEEILFSGGKLAGDMAELQALKKQLTRVEKELAQSVRLRSAVNEIKTTEEALAEIDEAIANTEYQIVTLEMPSVTCIGL